MLRCAHDYNLSFDLAIRSVDATYDEQEYALDRNPTKTCTMCTRCVVIVCNHTRSRPSVWGVEVWFSRTMEYRLLHVCTMDAEMWLNDGALHKSVMTVL